MEPLPDLPVEAPDLGAVPTLTPAQGAAAAKAAPAGIEGTQSLEFLNPELLAASEEKARPAPAPASAPEPASSTESTLTLLKPEFLISGDEAPAAASPAAASGQPETAQALEVDPDAPLSLEDTFEVDKMLSAPPPPAPPPSAPRAAVAPSPPAPAARSALAEEEPLTLIPESRAGSAKSAAATKPASGSPAPAAKASETPPGTPVLVPLARRASLNAAAIKLAAASAAPPVAVKPPKPAAPPAPVAPLKPRAPAAVPVTPTAKSASVTPSPAAAPEMPAATAATPPEEAPSLASWANARAAAAASAKASPGAPRTSTSAPKPAAPAPAEKPRTASASTRPAAAPAAPAPAPAAAPASTPPRGMDRDFIARNQVVERYLSGKLPIKAATDFERYCKEHPHLLDELGLPERVNAGLRLLEASGKPEPWQEASRPIWQQPAVIGGLAGLALVLAVSLAVVAASSSSKSRKLLDLQRAVVERTLDAATSTRVVRLLPNRSGASNTPALVIGGGRDAQLMDFRIDESRSPYKDFRVTIDRIDQGRVMIIDNLTKDSNGHLRVALNSSAFGPGNYLLTIEGLTMRLEPQPDSWVTIGVAQR
jgi:hypothetical protein